MDSDSPVSVASEMLRNTAARVVGRGGRGSLRSRVLSGSVIMLISSGIVGATNLIYNLAIAHGLGAAAFGHASAVYTVLMLLSAVTLSFQLLCSKFVAKNDSLPVKVGIYHILHRRAWLAGLGLSVVLLITSPAISGYLNLPKRSYVDMLAAGLIFYIPLGVRRGFMQGMYDFTHLALNFVLEVVTKLFGALLLIDAGFGVPGVIAAVVASIVLAYLFGMPKRELADSHATVPAALEEGVQASVFFVGQVIINNLDIVLVKHFFTAVEAGVYAAVALVGRVVYMLSWSVVSGMFPFSARVRSNEQDGRGVLSTALLLVVLITSLFTLGVWLTPARLWHLVLGSGFPSGSQGHYSSLLVLYAVTTGIYSLSVVLMSYEISRKIGNVSWLQLGIGGAIIGGIYLLHNTLQDVITVQLVLMIVLLLMVSIPFLRAQSSSRQLAPQVLSSSSGSLIRVQRVREEEVIAEFLKSEFFQPEFDRYREQFREVVDHPDLSCDRENELRRALLFLRRGRLWRELPADTEWWEIRLEASDLGRIRAFPRNHWRRFAETSFYLSEMVEHIQEWVDSRPSDPFVVKLRSLSEAIAQSPEPYSSVLLIGVDDRGPMTIIEGNHRMAAASLLFPEEVHSRFRFLCGFSPRMTQCCWYQTDLSTLWRYARNFVTYFLDDHEVVIQRALRSQLEVEPPGSSGLGAA